MGNKIQCHNVQYIYHNVDHIKCVCIGTHTHTLRACGLFYTAKNTHAHARTHVRSHMFGCAHTPRSSSSICSSGGGSSSSSSSRTSSSSDDDDDDSNDDADDDHDHDHEEEDDDDDDGDDDDGRRR